MNSLIKGTCYVCGDNVTVYQIVPEKRWTMKKMDGEAMGKWLFETYDQAFAGKENAFRKSGYEIIVAGKNFGCGSKTVEHPVMAMLGAGVKLVIADSFSRYSYRNAINLALPVLICPGIEHLINRGDVIEVDIEKSQILNTTTGKVHKTLPLGEFAYNIIAAGGLLNNVMQEEF